MSKAGAAPPIAASRRGSMSLAAGSRRGSMLVDDLGASLFSPGRGGNIAGQDEAIANSLDETWRSLEDCIGRTMDKVIELQEAAAEQLPPEEAKGVLALEQNVHDAFDGLLRSVEEIVKEMSASDAKKYQQHFKTASKLLESKLETARTAAKRSLENKSIEMAASFDKQLKEKVAAMNDGGGALLLEAQEKAEELAKQLADERVKHEACKEALKLSQKSLGDREVQLSRAEEERARLDLEMTGGKAELTDALATLKQKVQEMTSENSSLAETLDNAFKELNVTKQKSKSLSEQVAELVAYHEAFKRELDGSRAKLQEERDECEAELEKAAARHAQEMRELKKQLSSDAEVRRLQEEIDSVRSSLESAFKDLGITKQLNKTLSEQIQELIQSAAEGKSKVAELTREVDEKDDELQRLNEALQRARLSEGGNTSALNAHIEELEKEVKARGTAKAASDAELRRLQEETNSARANLEAAFKDLGITKQANKTLAEQIQELGKETNSVRTSLEAAFKDLGISKQANKTLSQQIQELGKETNSVRASLEAAFKDLGVTKQANKTLSQQIQEMGKETNSVRASLEAAFKDLGMTKQLNKTLSEQIQELIAKATGDAERAAKRIAQAEKDSEWWHGEARRLKEEMELCESTLQQALSSVELIKNDKRQLSEQIRDLLKRYRTTEDALNHTSAELVNVTDALQRSTEELGRRAEASRQERGLLVRAALSSLQQLRSHLTFTLSGLRVVQLQGEHASMPWKRAGGLISPRGDPMLVRFVPPLHKSLDPTARPAEYLPEDFVSLPPVQIAPPGPLSPPEVWHSDTPSVSDNPMWPSKRAGKAMETHRWGAVPRPPQHQSPRRAATASSNRSNRATRLPSSARATRAAHSANGSSGGGGSVPRTTTPTPGMRSMIDAEQDSLHRWNDGSRTISRDDSLHGGNLLLAASAQAGYGAEPSTLS